MLSPSVKPTEVAALLTTIDPASIAASTVLTAWVSVADYHNFLAIISTGVLGASATVDAKVRQAQDSSGTGAKDISGKAITQLLQASSGSSKQALINFRSADLDANNGFSFVAISLTIAVATSPATAELWGFSPRFAPPVDASAPIPYNLGAASVVQIV